MKSGLGKIFLKFLHALTISFLLLNFDQKYKFSNKNNMVSEWKNFKNIFPRPLFIIIFRLEMLKFHPYSILTGDTRVEFVIYCVLIKFAYNPQLRRNGHYSLEHPPNERSRYRMQKCYCAPISQATPDHLWFDVLFEVNRTSYPSYYLLLGFSFLRLLSFSGGTMST